MLFKTIFRLFRRTYSTSSQQTATNATKTTASTKSLPVILYRDRNYKQLVKNFKKLSEDNQFRSNDTIYEVTVRRLGSSRKFKLIQEILEDQKKYKEISDESFNVRLISLYGKSGMFDDAQKVFDEMAEKNCKRTILSFNALLNACVNSKKFDKVDELLRELPQKLEIEPDLVSYNIVMKAYCQMGSFDVGVSLLDEMANKGVRPNLITFNILLNGFYPNGRFQDGERVWKRMVDLDVVPDYFSYNAKMRGLVLEKRTNEAVQLIEEMKSKGIEPDICNFISLIQGFVKEKNLEQAKFWFYEMERSDCKPDKHTYLTLFPFVCEKDDLGFAFELAKVIINRKYDVKKKLLQRVLDGLVKASMIQEAKELEKLGKDNGHFSYQLKLNNHQMMLLSFNELLKAGVSSKEFYKVNSLFKELPLKWGIEPNLASYNTIMKVFCRKDYLDCGIPLLDEMEKKGLQPNLNTFNILLQGLYANGCFEDGERIWSRMANMDIFPDKWSYNARLAMEKGTHDAVNLVEEMKLKGIKLDVDSFIALITGYVKEENLEQAKFWFYEIGKSGCTPNKCTFRTLFPFVCKKDDLGFAFELSKVIIHSREYVVETELLQCVVDGLVKASKIQEAEELVHLGKDDGHFTYNLTLKNVQSVLLSFNALLKTGVNSKEFDKVHWLFREFPMKWMIKPDLVSYNTVIAAFCQKDSLDPVISLLDEMENKGLHNNLISFNIILNELYASGRFGDGDTIWNRMLQKDISPDVKSYNSRLLGLASEKRTDDAIKLVKEMRSKGIKPDVNSFNALIKGFVKEENLEQVKHWFYEIENSECKPDSHTFAILFSFVCKTNDLVFAFELSKAIINNNCRVKLKLLQNVVDGLVMSSKTEEAKELVRLGKGLYKLKLPSDV